MTKGQDPVVVDVAGAFVGGAARFLYELDKWLDTNAARVQVIGRGHRLNPTWMLRREAYGRGHDRVALNNASFLGGNGQRTVLLRNALHFLSASERNLHSGDRSPLFSLETQVVRHAAQRADRVIVPSTAMAERVVRTVPKLASTIEVRHHPLSAVSTPARSAGASSILIPVIFSGYKKMTSHIEMLVSALRLIADRHTSVRITAARRELPSSISNNPQITLLGRLSPMQLADEWANCRALYYPTGLEAFGYPLAEARVKGLPAIAQDTAQNQEIAAGALRGFRVNDLDSLAEAVGAALNGPGPRPDPEPFAPDAYFRSLFNTDERA